MSKLGNKSTILWAVLALSLYTGSYFALSRSSEAMVRRELRGERGFFYVPVSVATIMERPDLQQVNQAAIVFYYPVWALDHLFGGPEFGGLPMGRVGSEADGNSK